jgi:hypothetical protein
MCTRRTLSRADYRRTRSFLTQSIDFLTLTTLSCARPSLGSTQAHARPSSLRGSVELTSLLLPQHSFASTAMDPRARFDADPCCRSYGSMVTGPGSTSGATGYVGYALTYLYSMCQYWVCMCIFLEKKKKNTYLNTIELNVQGCERASKQAHAAHWPMTGDN